MGKTTIKTKGFSKEKYIYANDPKHQNNEVVFSCTINEYTLEVKVIKEDSNFICFQQGYLKTISYRYTYVALTRHTGYSSKKQRWLDLISFINRIEGSPSNS